MAALSALTITAYAIDRNRRVEMRFPRTPVGMASFSSTAPSTATGEMRAAAGWHLAELTCPEDGVVDGETAADTPCLVVSALRLIPPAAARP